MSKILRLPMIIDRTGSSRSSIHLQMKQGSFPANFLLSTRTAGWLESDISAWIESKIQKTRPHNV